LGCIPYVVMVNLLKKKPFKNKGLAAGGQTWP